jgi:HK97 family phage portal protein
MGIVSFFTDKIKKKNITLPKQKESRVAAIATGLPSVMWPEKDYKKYCEETYMKNVIGYKAIKLIADACSSVPWGLFEQKTNGEKTEVFNTPFNKILLRANPWESYTTIVYSTIAYLLLAGNSYQERVKPTSGPNNIYPKEIYTHQPDKVNYEINQKNGRIGKYVYQDDGKNVNWPVDQLTGQCDLLHLKMFNPVNKYFGMGATEPASRDIDINNLATEWNMRLIQNQNRPGMLLLFKGVLTDEQYERLDKQFAEVTGPSEAGKSLILESEEGVIDAKPYNWSPAEMDWLEANRETARRISLAFGVPSMMLGIPGDNTYSNYAEARAAMWEDSVIPLLNYYRDEKNNWHFGLTYGTNQSVLMYDYSLDKVPALQIRRDAIWQRVKEADFLTIDEKREMIGKQAYEGPDPTKPGSYILVSSSMVPLDENFVMPPEDDPNDPNGFNDEGNNE